VLCFGNFPVWWVGSGALPILSLSFSQFPLTSQLTTSQSLFFSMSLLWLPILLHCGQESQDSLSCNYSLFSRSSECLCLFFFFLMVELELRASCLLSRNSTTWATPPALFCVGHFRDRISGTTYPGLTLNCDPPDLCFLSRRITGVSHQHSTSTSVMTGRPSLQMASCHSNVKYGEWRVVLYAVGLLCWGNHLHVISLCWD
jgi:hypothetical protein